VTPDGDHLGVMSIQDARAAAEERGLDLIEVAPDSKPPVCRIIDYGKFRYEQRKKQKDAQKKSKQNEIKGIRVRPNTDDHDIDFKARNAIKFLRKGDKVKFTVIFRGPELRHKEIGQHQLERFAQALVDYATIDQPPRMEGRRMTMVMDPKKVMPPPKAGEGVAEESAQAEDEDTTGRDQAFEDDFEREGSTSGAEAESSAVEEEQPDEEALESGD